MSANIGYESNDGTLFNRQPTTTLIRAEFKPVRKLYRLCLDYFFVIRGQCMTV